MFDWITSYIKTYLFLTTYTKRHGEQLLCYYKYSFTAKISDVLGEFGHSSKMFFVVKVMRNWAFYHNKIGEIAIHRAALFAGECNNTIAESLVFG